jgi:hypothetical protein
MFIFLDKEIIWKKSVLEGVVYLPHLVGHLAPVGFCLFVQKDRFFIEDGDTFPWGDVSMWRGDLEHPMTESRSGISQSYGNVAFGI